MTTPGHFCGIVRGGMKFTSAQISDYIAVSIGHFYTVPSYIKGLFHLSYEIRIPEPETSSISC